MPNIEAVINTSEGASRRKLPDKAICPRDSVSQFLFFQPAFLLTKTWQPHEANEFPSLCAQGVVTIVSKTDQTPRTIMNRHETYDGQILVGLPKLDTTMSWHKVAAKNIWPLPKKADTCKIWTPDSQKLTPGLKNLPYRHFYTQTLLHTNTFHAQKLLHTEAFTHRSFYTQTLSHTDRTREIAILPQFLAIELRFACKGCDGYFKIAILPQFLTSNVHFVRKGCDGYFKIAILPQFLAIEFHFARQGCDGYFKTAILPQFLTSNVHFVRKGCDGYFKIAILPQFLTSNVHFVRKGCDGYFKIAILPQFLTSNVHFVWKGCDGYFKIAILPQFLTSNIHFVRKGCVSWRSGGTAPALRER